MFLLGFFEWADANACRPLNKRGIKTIPGCRPSAETISYGAERNAINMVGVKPVAGLSDYRQDYRILAIDLLSAALPVAHRCDARCLVKNIGEMTLAIETQ